MIHEWWSNRRSVRSSSAPKDSRKGRKAASPSRRSQLRLEHLEDRVVPTAGTLDPTFGTGGKVLTYINGFDQVNAVVTLSDNSVIAAGQTYNASTGYDFAIAKYHSNGTLDSSFGTGGIVTTDFFGFNDDAQAIDVLSNGNIVVAGTAFNPATGNDFALAEYNSSGALVGTFGAGGLVTTGFFGGGDDEAFALAVDSSNNLVVGGYAFNPSTSSNDFAVARYLPSGLLDVSFNGVGYVTTDFAGGDDEIQGLAIQPNGMIVAGGFAFTGSSYDFAAARYTTTGALDVAGFGTGGKVTTDFTGSDDLAHAVALTSGGDIILGGQTANPTTGEDFALAEYDSSGTLVPGFGTGGLVTTDFFGIDDEVRALAVQSNGKILAAGFDNNGTDYDFAIAQYNTDGTLDTSFGLGGTGQVTTDFNGGSDLAYALSLSPNGTFVVAGTAQDNLGNQDFGLARYQGVATTDVLIDGSGNLVVTDIAPGGKNDDLSISLSGSNVIVHDPNNILFAGAGTTQIDPNTVSAPYASITGQELVTTFGGNDLLTVDYVGGDPLPAAGLNYDAGTGTSDGLVVKGSGTQTAVYTPDATTTGKGTVVVNGQTISFVNLKPLDITGMLSATLQTPAGTSNNTLTIADGTDFFAGGINDALRVSGTLNNSTVGGSDGTAIETVAFYNDSSLVIDTSLDNAGDQVTITSADNSNGIGALTVQTTSGANTLVINGSVSFPVSFDAEVPAIDLNAGVSGGDVTFNGAVVLGTDVVVFSESGGTITFGSTVDSSAGNNYALATFTDGVVAFDGAVGGMQPLSSLDAEGFFLPIFAEIDLNGGVVKTTGDQFYGNPVILTSTTNTLTSTGAGDITFVTFVDSSFGNNYALTVITDGTTTFGDEVGGDDPLSTLTTEGFTHTFDGTTDLNGGYVETTNDQVYDNPVVLSTFNILVSDSGPLTFADTVDSISGEHHGLIAVSDGTITFDAAVGSNRSLLFLVTTGFSLSDSGTTDLNGGSVTTRFDQTYENPVILTAASTTLTSTRGGDITFLSTLDSSPTHNYALTTVTNGTAEFDDAVGGTTPLSTLTTEGLTTTATGTTDLNGGAVTTTAAQYYDNAVILSEDNTLASSGGNITFAGTVDSSSGDNFALTTQTDSTTTFDGAVGGTDKLSSLTTEGFTLPATGTTDVNGGTVTTTGAQSYDNAVMLTLDTVLTSTATGAIAFASTVNGGYNLTVNTAGTTTFGGAVGGSTPLTSVTTDAPGSTDINGGSVKTTGMQCYGDAVVLGAADTLTSTTGNIHFKSTVDSDALATPRDLTLSAGGNINADLAVGSSFPLGSLTISTAVNATFTSTVATSTTGGHTGNVLQSAGTGLTTFNGGTVAGSFSITTANITLNSTLNVTLGSSLTLAAAGTGNINGTIVSGTAGTPTTITLTNGTFNFNGANSFSSGFNDVVLVKALSAPTLKFNNNSQTFGSLASTAAGAAIQLGSATLTTGGDNATTTFAGSSASSGGISGTGGVTKQGTGNFTLTGTNTFSGATNVYAGTLTVGVNNALASTTSVTINFGTANSSTLALGAFNDTVGGVHLIDGSITGTGILTSGTTFDLQKGSVSVVLAGSVGLTKSTGATVTLTSTSNSTYSGATTISGGTLTENGSLSTSASTVTLSGAGVTLNGTGTINRPVIVSSTGDTIGAAGAGNGLTIVAAAGKGITVNSTGTVSILGNTVKTGSGYNNTAIYVNGGTALIQDNNLAAIGLQTGPTFTATSLPTVSSPYYGIYAIGGAIIDAGQISGANFTGLGISAGNNTLTGYQSYTGTAIPSGLSKAVAQAILNDNTNSPNNLAGPRGQPYDLYAQNNNFGVTVVANNYYPIELLVWHDTDLGSVGFVNYVTPSAGAPQLLTTMFYAINAAELGGQMITFSQRIAVMSGSFTLTLNGNTTQPIPWSNSPSTLASNIQTKLAALPFVGTGNVVVAGIAGTLGTTSPTGVFTITFTGALAQTAEPAMTYNAGGLSGGTISSLDSFANQKSMIRRISFTFNNYVVITSGGIGLTMQGAKATTASTWSPGGTINLTATQIVFDPFTGQFRYEYGFAAGQTGVESSGSLTDGDYQLAFNTSHITSTGGTPATVPATNNPNSATPTHGGSASYNGSAPNYTLNFHRMFGDLDGVGLINADDFNAMAVALGHLTGSGGYYAGLDFNQDGSIDTTTDNPQFTTRKNDYSITSYALGWDV